MSALIADTVSWACLLIGGFFVLAGGIGVLRMPDVYARSHAGGLTDTGGTLFIIAGLMVQAGFDMVTIKLALILMFLFFTSPTATHALVHAAHASGVRPILAADTTAPAEDAEEDAP